MQYRRPQNTTAIRGWWQKLAWHCKPNELDECKAIWQYCHDLDQVAEQLCNTSLRNSVEQPVSNSVEQPALAITQSPLVWALLEEHPDNDAIQWLLDKILWGEKLTSLKLLQTGETIPLEEEEEEQPVRTSGSRL